MAIAGADEIYLLGGVQAVVALALGTETIDRVNLIAGPGNAYVAEAKRQLFGEVGIDLFAGPTEILVIADEHADPFVVAVDLLSQAEHGPDSPAVLVTTSEDVAHRAMEHIDRILPGMPTRDMAGPAWRDHGQVLVVDDIDEAFAVADTFASEHVEVLTDEPRRALDAMHDYGALFLGEGTCVSYGDKVDRHQPRAAHSRQRPLHRRALGRQVPARRSPTRRSPTLRRAQRSANSAAGRRGSSSSRATPARATSAPRSTARSNWTGRPHAVGLATTVG